MRGDHHRRHGEDDHERSHQHRPDEQGDAVERHAGRTLLEDRDDGGHRHRQGRHLGVGDHLRPDVGPLAGREFRAGEGHVGEPADVRAHVEHKGSPGEDAARQVDPVAEGIQAGKGDVARANHERDQKDPTGLHHRHGEQEHHGHAVHGEQLVVEVGSDQAPLRPRQLQAHQDGVRARRAPERRRPSRGSGGPPPCGPRSTGCRPGRGAVPRSAPAKAAAWPRPGRFAQPVRLGREIGGGHSSLSR